MNRLLICVLVTALAVVSPSLADGRAVAPEDSTAHGIVDSTATLLPAEPPASKAEGVADTTSADPARVVDPVEPPPDFVTPPRAPMDLLVGPALLQWRRPDTLEDVIEAVPGASLRIAGDTGMPAYLSLSPISGPAPELWVDGMPTRNPADLDPGIWDRSAINVGRVSGRDASNAGGWGGPQLWIESDPALQGRTYFRSYFSTVRQNETYSRGISVTTPAAERVVRLDFEEWKTEEGTDYSAAPSVVADVLQRGRSKMRRFRVTTDFQTDAGRLKMFFGRGRRYFRGSALRATSTERWTGELGIGLDHRNAQRSWRTRAYHIDVHDQDEAYGQVDSGARTGLRVDRVPEGAGWQAGLSAETRVARFEAPVLDVVLENATRTHEVRAAMGWRPAMEASTRPWATLEGAWSEHTDQR